MNLSHRLRQGLAALAGCLVAASAHLPAFAALDLPTGCQEGIPATCRYASDESYADQRSFDFQFIDHSVDANGYVVPYRVRWPVGGAGRMPLVLWLPDGGVNMPTVVNGNLFVEGMASSERRARSFAAAGYVVVHLGRTYPSWVPSQNCTQIGLGILPFVLEPCLQLHGNYNLGPQAVRSFVQRLRRGAALLPPALAQRVDLDRIVIAGRGVGSVLLYNLAGVPLHWEAVQGYHRSTTFDAVSVPGVVAYYADSPESPTLTGVLGNGVGDADLLSLTRLPMMFMTGRGDATGKGARAARGAAWQMAPAGEKYLAWVRAARFGGETIGLDPGGCNSVAEQAACDVLEMLGVAYLDAVVKRKPAALRWLASDAIAVAGAQLIELHRR